MHQETRDEKRLLMTYGEVEELLQVKRSTIYGWVSRGVIPFVRLSGRVVRFRRDEITTWIDAGKNSRKD